MLTQDPIGLAGGVNLYAYAGNNPVAFSDPWGLCAAADTGRALTASECQTYADHCARMDCNQVRVHDNDASTDQNTMRTKGNDIYVGTRTPDMTAKDYTSQLGHELTHVVQRKEEGWLKYNVKQLGDAFRTNPYAYQLSPGSKWSDFGHEQQGMIVEHCFDGNASACAVSPFQLR